MSGPSSDAAIGRFFGNALMVIGVIMLVFWGLCAGIGLLAVVASAHDGGGRPLHYLASVVAQVVPPIVIALVLLFLGRWIVRRNRPAATIQPPQDQA